MLICKGRSFSHFVKSPDVFLVIFGEEVLSVFTIGVQNGVGDLFISSCFIESKYGDLNASLPM